MTWTDELFEILSSFNHDDFHVGSAMKQKHLQSAVSFHGVDVHDEVLTVVDSTVFGSAENGMSITSLGVFWKNDWTTKTRTNRLSWSEIVELSPQLEASGSNVLFAPGVAFYSLKMKPAQIVSILQTAVRSYKASHGKHAYSESGVSAQTAAPTPDMIPPLAGATGSNGYAQSLGRYLAVVACHAGTADEPCVDVAVELLTDEEAEFPGAVAAFSDALASLEQEHRRSATFFKLKQAKILAEVLQLSVDQEERIAIMCQAVAEAATEPSAGLALDKAKQVLARD